MQGLVHNYGGLLGKLLVPSGYPLLLTALPGMRWMLGVFEAGLFPGVNYYLSWCVSDYAPVTQRPQQKLTRTLQLVQAL